MSEHYVVDTSVLVQAMIADSESARVESLLAMLDQPEPVVLHLPEFCLVECANVLWKRVRFLNTPEYRAKAELQYLLVLPLTIHTSATLLSHALEIALDNHLAVYDCVHIALAQSLACPLITVDQRQTAAAQSVAVELKPITDFPEYQNGT